MTAAILVTLTTAACLFGIRVVRGPSLVDRVIAVDGIVICAVAGIAVDAVAHGDARFADAAILLALIAFVGTGVTARFIEHRGG